MANHALIVQSLRTAYSEGVEVTNTSSVVNFMSENSRNSSEITRRCDHKTAEVVDVILQTRAAFGLDYALHYIKIAELRPTLLYRILARPARKLRGQETIAMPTNPAGRRREQRR